MTKSCFGGGGGGWGVSEIKCIIIEENDDNAYEINNNYFKLSIIFHTMQRSTAVFFSRLAYLYMAVKSVNT
jgi:hypothetical protein